MSPFEKHANIPSENNLTFLIYIARMQQANISVKL